MAADDAWIRTTTCQLNSIRQHCEHWSNFYERLQDLDGHAVVVGGRSKRRRTSRDSACQRVLQPSGSPQQPEPQSTLQASLGPRTSPSSKALRWQTLEMPRQKAWFLRNAPKPAEWRKRQVDFALITTEEYERTVRAFTGRTAVTVERCPYLEDENVENDLVELAKSFALLTPVFLTDAKRQRSFATFRTLILLSFCEILSKRDVSLAVIDRIIEHVAGEREPCYRGADKIRLDG